MAHFRSDTRPSKSKKNSLSSTLTAHLAASVAIARGVAASRTSQNRRGRPVGVGPPPPPQRPPNPAWRLDPAIYEYGILSSLLHHPTPPDPKSPTRQTSLLLAGDLPLARPPCPAAMASGQDSSGTTLMDLITSDPSAASGAGASSQQQSSSGSGGGGGVGSLLGKPAPADRKSKKVTLTQIQNETISAAKALNPVKVLPQRNRKKKARPPSPPSRHFYPARSSLTL